MRAVVFDGHRPSVQTVDTPVPDKGQALIRIHRAGVCNTDLEIFAGYMGFRGIPGHEFVGTVEVGDAAWRGARVVGEINVADGTCDLCLEGIPSQCRGRTTVGIDRHDGGFAEYLALTTRNLHRVPDGVSDDEAVYVEPLAAAIAAVDDAVPIAHDDRLVIIGAGKLGLLTAQAAKARGLKPTVVVRREAPMRLLHEWQISTAAPGELPERRAHVVIDCTGNSEGFASALKLVRPRGAIVLKSTYTAMPVANLTQVVIDEVRVVGSRCGSFPKALEMLSAGAVDVNSMTAVRYPLEQAEAAFAHAAQPGMLKVLIDMN
jgi:2-desacetyl-2-hydroxyethyl bacteriochlorophyllide A dehydrogenase